MFKVRFRYKGVLSYSGTLLIEGALVRKVHDSIGLTCSLRDTDLRRVISRFWVDYFSKGDLGQSVHLPVQGVYCRSINKELILLGSSGMISMTQIGLKDLKQKRKEERRAMPSSLLLRSLTKDT